MLPTPHTPLFEWAPFTALAPSTLSEAYSALNEQLTQQLYALEAEALKLSPSAFAQETLPQLSENALASLDSFMKPLEAHPSVMICQWHPMVGHIAYNTAMALASIQQAEALGVELLVFPEGFLFGYPMRDLITRYPWKVDQQTQALHVLAKASGTCRVLMGCVEPNPDWATARAEAPWRANPKRFFNSVAILGEGKLLGVVRKHAMATYQQYDDERVFEPSKFLGVLPAMAWGMGQGFESQALPFQYDTTQPPACLTLPSGKRIAVLVCEDAWRFPEGALQAYQQAYTPAEVDLVCNLSASVGREAKQVLRRALLESACAKTGWALLYVNQVGAMDECVFDGDSQLWVPYEGATPSAQEHWRAGAYHPTLAVIPWQACKAQGTSEPTFLTEMPPALPTVPSAECYQSYVPECLPSELQHELARCFVALRSGIQTYFQRTGHCRAVLGMSGGLDSAVTAALLVLSLGPENVLMVSMPSVLTPEDNQADVATMAQRLGCALVTLPMQAHTQATMQAIRGVVHDATSHPWQWEPTPVAWSTAPENVQAMQRATMLRLLANDYQALPIATSDKSEFYLGYATVNGDMSGALAPLGDVCKTKVRALGRWMNQHTQALWRTLPNEGHGFKQGAAVPETIIPPAMVERPSGADLAVNPATGKLILAEEALMPYAFADECIWRTELRGESLDRMMRQSFWIERHGGLQLSAEQKRQWLEKFFQRVQAASFKWWVAPPMVLCDRVTSLGHNCYHHPIVSRL
ncbi:MAG: NAD(+) synthase [Vampirovibrionales bacterium]